MVNKTKRSNARARAGCGYILGLGILICALLFINSMIVEKLIESNESLELDKRITQAAQFIVPLVLIFFQFWFFDFAAGFFRKTE